MAEARFTNTVTTILSKEMTKYVEKPSNELECLQGNIIVAPISIAVLGHVMLLSTRRDFSLVSKSSNNPDVSLYEKKGNFKYITQPESFRATLIQVSEVVYHAFLCAHSNMEKIEGACDNAQDHIRLIIDNIFEGDNSDMNTLIPNSLQSTIYKEFHIALNLLEEVHCSCHTAQMTNQEKLKELEHQKMVLELEMLKNEKSKHEKESHIKEHENKVHQELCEYHHLRTETEQRIKDYQNELEYKKDQLKSIKEERSTAAGEVRRAYANRGWGSWTFSYKTSDIENAEKKKSEKDEAVRKKENEVRTKERSVENEKNILEEKRKAMVSTQNMVQGDIVKTTQNIDAISDQIKPTLAKLNATNVTKLEMEDVKNLLKEGIEQIAELEGHLKNLILFFDSIGDITKIVLGKAIEDFTNATETATLGVIEGSEKELSNFRKKVIVKFALETCSRCIAVGKVSKSYMMISKNHLIPAISDLSTIVSLDSQRDAEKIAEKKKGIQTRCEKTVNYVINHAKLQSEIQILQAFQLK